MIKNSLVSSGFRVQVMPIQAAAQGQIPLFSKVIFSGSKATLNV
jgi:hypothetical protein